MPRENKKRGRRAETQSKSFGNEHVTISKRQKHDQGDSDFHDQHNYVPLDHDEEGEPTTTKPFYGLLDEEEQELFRNAMDTLNFHMDEFSEPGDLQEWVKKMYQHAKGKELKLANSQSCSRFMEMLIQLSTPEQLKGLIQSFSSNFMFLCQHRFASHCVEALLENAAPTVTAEMSSIAGDGLPAMEDLVLGVARELEAQVAWMMTNTFASHPLRVLLLVLAGQPIPKTTSQTVLHGRKKEHVSVVGINKLRDSSLDSVREVPSSFSTAIDGLISNAVGGIDTDRLQWLSAHRSANPMLQLLLRLEKQRAKDESSILHLLLPDDPIVESSPSGVFINALLYAPVGSRLIETILEVAPGKMFKAIYKAIISPNLVSLARNDVACYPVCTAFTRLSGDDLLDAVAILGPEFPALVERNRLQVIRTLVDRCGAREVGSGMLTRHLKVAFAGPKKAFDIAQLLRTAESTESGAPTPLAQTHQNQKETGAGIHGSLLVQSFLLAPAPLSNLTLDSLSLLPQAVLRRLALSPVHSHTLKTALTTPASLDSPIQLRRLIGAFEGEMAQLALDRAGSRVLQAMWPGTARLAFLRERVAGELAEASGALLDSTTGRAAWRAWRMDEYRSSRVEWLRRGRESGRDGETRGGFQGAGEDAKAGRTAGRNLSAIDRARQKHFDRKAARELDGDMSTNGKEF